MMTKNTETISLKNSNSKDTRILFMSDDVELCRAYEARSEVDPDLLRIDLYCTDSIEEAKKIIRFHAPQMVILPSKLGSRDYAYIEAEISAPSQNTKIILLSKQTNALHFRQAVRSGKLLDVVSPDEIVDYEGFKKVVLEACRTFIHHTQTATTSLDRFLSIQAAMTINDAKLAAIKDNSSLICPLVLRRFDLSAIEKSKVTLANMIYSPLLSVDQIDRIVPSDDEVPKMYLSEASSGDSPKSSISFILRFNFFVSERIVIGSDIDSIYDEIKSRPLNLKHPSIRAIDKTIMEEIENSLKSKFDNVAGG